MCWVWLNHPKIINLSHKGKANERVIDMWLVLVKINGNNPIKLLNKMNANSEIKMKVLPLWLNGPNKVLNSLCKVFKIIIQIIINRDGINQ